MQIPSTRLWPALRALAATSLLLSALIVQSSSAGAQASDPRFFSQTGYRVDADAFWSFFRARGGVRTFGFPVSRSFKLDGFPVQIFQRLVVQLQPDGSVATLNLLDAGVLPYTRINGSTFPAPDPAVISQTVAANDPAYADKIVQFIQNNVPDVFAGNQVNFLQTFNTTVTYESAFPAGDGPRSLLPLLNL